MKFLCNNLKKEFDFKIEETTKKPIFRNYATIANHQNLLDDLLGDKDEQSDVQSMIDAFSGIEKDNIFFSRPFRYAKAFPEVLEEDLLRPYTSNNTGQYGVGRFGDGFGYGVFYAALDEETSIKESIYYALNEFEDRKKSITEDEFLVERKLIRIGFKGKLIDLTRIKELIDELVAPNPYDTCRSLGKDCSKHSIDGLLVPSARSQGTCIPIFSADAITDYDRNTSFVYNFQICILKKDPSNIILREIKNTTYVTDDIKNFKRSQG